MPARPQEYYVATHLTCDHWDDKAGYAKLGSRACARRHERQPTPRRELETAPYPTLTPGIGEALRATKPAVPFTLPKKDAVLSQSTEEPKSHVMFHVKQSPPGHCPDPVEENQAMPKYRVLKRIDAYVNYIAEIEAKSELTPFGWPSGTTSMVLIPRSNGRTTAIPSSTMPSSRSRTTLSTPNPRPLHPELVPLQLNLERLLPCDSTISKPASRSGTRTASPSILIGRVGRGKTTTISRAPARIAKHLGKSAKSYGFVCIAGTLLNPPDAVGYMMPRNVGDHLEAVFTQPFWFRTDEGKLLTEYEGGMILIDEADKMDVDVKKIMGEMALSGRLGPHRLPSGWVVWFAGNTAKRSLRLDQGVRSPDQPPHADRSRRRSRQRARFLRFEQRAPCLHRLRQEQPAGGVRGAAAGAGSMVHATLAAPAGQLRRRARQANRDDVPTDHLFREEATGKIGEGAAMTLFATLDLQKIMPKFEDIVARPKSTALPENPDAQMMVCYVLAFARHCGEHCAGHRLR